MQKLLQLKKINVLVAGAILPFAFAPLQIWPISIFSLGILFYYWLFSYTIKQAASLGFIFGLGFFGVGVSWVFNSIHDFGYTGVVLATLLTASFVGFLALFPSLNGCLLQIIFPTNHQQRNLSKLFLGMPITYMLFEWLRSWLFTGFPWLFIGYSQIDSPLAYFAPFIGVYGISLIIALISAILIFLIIHKHIKVTVFFILLLIISYSLNFYLPDKANILTNTNDIHTVRLVQGNLKPNDKFLLDEPLKVVWEKYVKPSFFSTNQSITPELIIWPENSLPVPLPYSRNFIDKLDHLAKQRQQTLIFGLPIEINTDLDSSGYYNSLITVGKIQARYDKQHLVAFGEYLPFDYYLRGLINFFDLPMSNFKPGLPTANKTKLLPLICYEIAFPQQVRNSLLQQAATAIVTISEDGWFGNSMGPHQHLEIARMRALENKRYVLRATTSGISAIINQAGKVIAKSPQFKEYVLDGKFNNITEITFWTKYGQWPLIIISFIILLIYYLKYYILVLVVK